MTATHDDTVAELQRTIGELRRERDTLQAREATLGEVLAARDAALAQRNSEYAERIEQQLATNDVLKAMSATLSDTQPVFDLITVRARELCGSLASMLFEFDGERLHLRSWGGWDPAAAQDYLRQFPMRPDRGTAVGRTTLDRCAVHIRDIEQDPEIAQTVRTMGVRSTLGVPLLRDGQVIGVIAIGLATVGGFSDSQVALLETFAEQAVIAITSAETSRQLQERTATLATRNTEYRERITHQSATIDVLKAMSGSPGDAQPVFDLIAERARDICGGYGVSVHEFDGSVLHLRAYTGVSEDPRVQEAYEARYPTSLTREVPVARAIMERRVTRFDDFDVDPGLSVVRSTVRSAVAVPMMRGNASIGGLIMGSRERGGFSDSQIELLKTFAEQAVIAITSAETYRTLQTRTRDLQQSLEYQTATSDVLKVISRSAYDLKAVLQALLDTAARLCAADFGALMIRDGDVFRTSAIIPISPEHEAFVRRKVFVPSPHGSVVERTAFARQITHTEDIATLSDYVTSGRGFVVSGTALGVPLFLEGDVVGVFTLHRQRTEPFTDAQIELVNTFADQAVIAIENTRLITEQQEALEQQTATAEVLQVINASPGNLAPVFDAMLEKTMRLCEAAFGYLLSYDGGQFQTVAHHGLPPRFAEYLPRMDQPSPTGAYARILGGAPLVHVTDLMDGDVYQTSPLRRALVDLGGARTSLIVAIRSDDRLLGIFTIYRREVRQFSDKQVALVESFAAQAAIAMENARLITEQREALEQQTATAEVLQVINANPGNLTPVFDAMLEKAMRLCEAAFGELDTFDGERFKPAALLGIPAAYAKVRTSTPRTGMPGTVDSRFRAGANVLHIADLMAEDI